MGIGINLKYFHDDDDYGSFNHLNDPRIPVVRKIIIALASIPEIREPQDLFPLERDSLGISITPGNQIIDVILVDNDHALEAWNMPVGSLGCHVVEDWQAEGDFADRHKVVINMSMNLLTDILDSEPDSDFDSLVESWLMTITHEVAHCVEFIECSGGLTPSVLNDLLDETGSEHSLVDFSTGSGISMPWTDRDNAIEIMEDRVENKARRWLDQIMPSLRKDVISMTDALRSCYRDKNRAQWPVMVRYDPFTHVGNLKGNAPNPRFSMEGSCVSVSDCPGDWQKIARLSGGEWYLQKEAALILDMLVAKRSTELKDIVLAWGCETGLVEQKTLYKVNMTDENGDEYYLVCDSKDEAMIEADEEEDCIECFIGWIGTNALREMQNFTGDIKDELAIEFCFMAYAEHVLNLDGIWWNEISDQANLSSPRGGLFNPASSEWEVTEKESMHSFHIESQPRLYFSPLKNDWVKALPEKIRTSAVEDGMQP